MAETDLATLTYKTVTKLGDFGPWISKLVLELPDEVGVNDVSPATFNVFCARRERTGAVLMRRERGADHAALDIAVYREQGKEDEGDHGHHAVRDGVADFLPERKAEHLPHQFLCHGLPPLPIRSPAGILAYIIAQKGEMLAQLLSFPFRQSRRIPAYTMLKRKIMI